MFKKKKILHVEVYNMSAYKTMPSSVPAIHNRHTRRYMYLSHVAIALVTLLYTCMVSCYKIRIKYFRGEALKL